MNFNQLEIAIYNTVQPVMDNLSIFIRTQEGDIKINATRQRKAASVAKVFILAETFRQVEKNSLSLDKLVHIERDFLAGGSGIINYLTDSRVYSYKNLIELMIIVSDNTASNVLLHTIGIENVNRLAKEIGCQHSRMERIFMDRNAQLKGLENYTSAHDIIRLLSLFSEYNNFFTKDSKDQILKILYDQQLDDKLPKYLSEQDQVRFFHKTGELEGVEHDVAIIKYADRTIEAAVLSEGWETNGLGQNYIADIGRLLIDYIKD